MSIPDNLEMQLFQLFLIDLAGRVDHQVLRGSSFRKRHYIADVFRWDEHHQGALDTRGNPAVRWRPVGERVKKETESRPRRLFSHAERFEYNGLHIAAVDSDR